MKHGTLRGGDVWIRLLALVLALWTSAGAVRRLSVRENPARCLTGERWLSVARAMYAVDYDGKLPPENAWLLEPEPWPPPDLQRFGDSANERSGLPL
jgi:hypothetical protein